MSWFSCCLFAGENRRIRSTGRQSTSRFLEEPLDRGSRVSLVGDETGYCVQNFSYKDLDTATNGFRTVNLIGSGGFGKVYKGQFNSGQMAAIKLLDHAGAQGNKEFLVEVLMLFMLRHPNIVSLIGYCSDGNNRILVYEYMPKRSLEDYLFDPSPGKSPLDWNTRVKIALGVAQGLQYLHDVANPPVIYRDLKAANVLLDNDFNPKLSDFGLAKLGPVGEKTHVSTRLMGTYGYCAPEYAMTGKLTVKCDVYSFGVLLMELVTGRKCLDSKRPPSQENLTQWWTQILYDQRKYSQLADPVLQGRYPPEAFRRLFFIASACAREQHTSRPLIASAVAGLKIVASRPYVCL